MASSPRKSSTTGASDVRLDRNVTGKRRWRLPGSTASQVVVQEHCKAKEQQHVVQENYKQIKETQHVV